MEKPDCAELNAILSTVSQIRDTEAQIVELKARLSSEAKGLSAVEDRNLRIKAAVYAYWFAPEAHVTDLSFGATGHTYAGELRQHIGAVPAGLHCDRCKTELQISSREQMKSLLSRSKREFTYAEGYRMLCGDCWAVVLAERQVEAQHQADRRAARGQEIARMSYGEYLDTDDWRGQRERHLSFLLDAFKKPLECEACSVPDQLGVYHRSYTMLGLRDDLILLCSTCRDALFAVGRLAGEPNTQNHVSKIHADLLALKHLDIDHRF